MSRVLSSLIAIALFIVFNFTLGLAQDFRKDYPLGAGGEISISAVSGDVRVIGYDGSTVIVTGKKHGRDKELVEVEDLSTSSRIELRTHYPKNCNCNASIDFELQVPRGVKYHFDKLSSASGDISVSDVTGDLKAKSASGDLHIIRVRGEIVASSASGDVEVKDVMGMVNAQSASGDVAVDITRLEGNGSMEFKSASGDVSVKIPANLDADVSMSTLSGSLNTDFPLQVSERESSPGSRAQGRIGNGSRQLHLSSVSGDVSLRTSSPK